MPTTTPPSPAAAPPPMSLSREALLQLMDASPLADPLEAPVPVAPFTVTTQGPGLAPAWWVAIGAHDGYGIRRWLDQPDMLTLTRGAVATVRLAQAWYRLRSARTRASVQAAWDALPQGAATRDPEGRPALWHGLAQVPLLLHVRHREPRHAVEPELLAARSLDGGGFWTFMFARNGGSLCLWEMLQELHHYPESPIHHPGDEAGTDGNGIAVRLLSENRLGEITLPATAAALSGLRMDGLWTASPATLEALRTRLAVTAAGLLVDTADASASLPPTAIRTLARTLWLCHICAGDAFAEGPALSRLAGPLGLLLMAQTALPESHPAAGALPFAPTRLVALAGPLLRAAAARADPALLDGFTAIRASLEKTPVHPATYASGLFAALALAAATEPLVLAARQRRSLSGTAARAHRKRA